MSSYQNQIEISPNGRVLTHESKFFDTLYSCSHCGGIIQQTPGMLNASTEVLNRMNKNTKVWKKCPYCGTESQFEKCLERK